MSIQDSTPAPHPVADACSEEPFILTVDDKPANLIVLKHVLRDLKATLIQVTNGQDALAASLKYRFAVAILDVQMPGMDGFELADILLSDPSTAHTPIIFVTATNPEECNLGKAYKSGAVDYLVKPYDPRMLVSKVQVFLEIARRERNLETLIAERTSALAATEERYRTLFQSMTQGVIYQDCVGRVIDANPAAIAILGIPIRQLYDRGFPCSDFDSVDARGLPLHGDRHPSMVALREGRSVRDFVMGIRRPGSRERVWIEVTSVPQFRTGDSRPHQVFTTFSDITLRLAAEQRVEGSERAMRAVFEGTGDGILALALDSLEIRLANHAMLRLLALPEPPPTGTRVSDFLARDQVSHLIGAESETAPDDSRTLELVIARRDGSTVVVETGVTPLVLNGERCLLAVMRDLTERRHEERERRRLAEELFRAQKMESIGMLAGGVAHDFNNLLQVISGYVDLALDSGEAGESLKSDLGEIRKAADRASELTRKLLAFGRKQKMHRIPLDLNQVTRGTDKLLSRILGEDIELRLCLDPEIGTVLADPGQLEQVIMNLAVNARDAMPDGGRLSCETANVDTDDTLQALHPGLPKGHYVRLRVSDTGCGMDEATVQRVFEPFFTTKPDGQGTGLGLATVYGIVKQSGGSVSVSSQLGHGTTFDVLLPRISEQPESHSEPHQPINEGLGGSETILVVDDADPVRSLTVRVLDAAGYKVLTASDGMHALQVLENFHDRIHMILADVVMPRMGGTELATHALKIRPDTRMLFMSGYSGDARRQPDGLLTQANLLTKPFRVEELLRKVRTVLEDRAFPFTPPTATRSTIPA